MSPGAGGPSPKPGPHGSAGVPRATLRRRSVLAFVGLCVVCVAVITVTVVRAVDDGGPRSGTGVAQDEATQISSGLLFRDTTLQRSFGRLALAGASPGATRRITPLTCSRASFAGGRGVCLTVKRNIISNYSALVFNERFDVERTIQLAGIPSRTRVSPSGDTAAITVFVLGHSYADHKFSTRTSFVDLRSGDVVEDMEQFTVTKDGSRVYSLDFNFWGVTFANDNRFFATLGTAGKTYLVEGDLAARRVEIVRDDMECPSLSPDGSRIAFKKPVHSGLGPVRWRLAVLDLASGDEHELAETRNVDDQVVWLDDERILYALTSDGEATPSTDDGQASIATDLWVTPAAGSGRPEVYVHGASSPAVVAASP